MAKQPVKGSAFGLFDYTMVPKINRLLKKHGLRLKKRSSMSWGDQVEITVEKISEKPAKKKRRFHFAIMSKFSGIGQTGCTWGENEADAMTNIEDGGDTLKRMASKDCSVCKM